MKKIIVAFLCIIIGCQDDYKKEIASKAFTRSDSIYKLEILNYVREADSICVHLSENKLQQMVDSIIAVRKEQVKQLRSLE
ncbi:MAG: hypothetical protein ABI851_01555 [Saprospiraceae bacterium]